MKSSSILFATNVLWKSADPLPFPLKEGFPVVRVSAECNVRYHYYYLTVVAAEGDVE